MKNMLSTVSGALIAGFKWCGDAAHRRAVTTAVVVLATHFGFKAIDAQDVGNVIDLAVAVAGGAWSRHTPQIDPPAA